MLTTLTTPVTPSTPYFAYLTTLGEVVHAQAASLESFKSRSGEKIKEATTLTLQSRTNKDKYPFNRLLLSPRP
jgi:hypothetical protein